MRTTHSRLTPSRASLLLLLAAIALQLGWAAPGHRTITRLAISLLPADVADWVRGPDAADMAAYQSNEPDRWRSTPSPVLAHENSADHYIDAELLADHALTLQTLPRLRYQFVEALLKTAPAPRPEPTQGARRGVVAFDPGTVGFLPHAIAEHYAKLVSSMNTARILDSLADPARQSESIAARANVLHEMGQLSHFVGDAGQPLHSTIHHHGWVGDNPHGYTTDRGFHRYIDDEVVALHALNLAGLDPLRKPMAAIPTDGVWDASIGLIQRSFDAIVPLYELEKSGALRGEPGRAFVAERMADSASVLASLYYRAWLDSAPTEQSIADFQKYDALAAEDTWVVSPAPGPLPAAPGRP